MPKNTKDIKKLNKVIKSIIFIIVIAIFSYFFDINYSKIADLFQNPYQKSENELLIHFVDVGQGDCIILQLPDDKNMIIDGGPINARQKVLDFIDSYNIDVFDYLMLTHTDGDHTGSLDDVINNTIVKKIYMPNVSTEVIDTNVYKDFIEAVKNENLKEEDIIYTKTGDSITGNGYEIVFFTPLPLMYEDAQKGNTNTISPIIILYYGGKSVMFTGDATEDTEEIFLDVINENDYLKNKNVDVDILKVAHHGSKSSSIQDFLDTVKPEISVISVGRNNSYNHPATETIERLKGYSDTILRTDIAGDISIKLILNTNNIADIIILNDIEINFETNIKYNNLINILYLLIIVYIIVNIKYKNFKRRERKI